jgi:hypothetical protein
MLLFGLTQKVTKKVKAIAKKAKNLHCELKSTNSPCPLSPPDAQTVLIF